VQISDETRYHLLKLLEQNPSISQREISNQLGLSLGKVNYCLQALVEKGWIKARNFKNSKKKFAYMYVFTPSGLEEKALVTYRFLRKKLEEINELRREIETLRDEAQRSVVDSKKLSELETQADG
jgi:EPS-associated MarR family transcriptional regulator